MATKVKSGTAECRYLFPAKYYDYQKRGYVSYDEPDIYDYNAGNLFCNCCGADFDAKLKGPSKWQFGESGITVYARIVDDIKHDEVVVEHINTKNGPITVATAISWKDYEPDDEDEDW